MLLLYKEVTLVLIQQAKLSPLHDSAGSQASSEAEESDLPGSDACSDTVEKPFQKLEELPDTEDQAANGISNQMGQDAAHFIGLPQQKSSLRSRQEPEAYQLSCSGQCGSLLANSGKVRVLLAACMISSADFRCQSHKNLQKYHVAQLCLL